MQALIPLLTSVGTGLIGKLFSSGSSSSSSQQMQQPKPKTLFTPEQISKATDTYRSEGNAKWNQIMAGIMGAGGGTGGDFTSAIGSQADSLAQALGKLTDQSGYGSDPMAALSTILKGVEGGIGAKYPVY